jgi:FeS assembly SUF system regulator
MIRMTKQTDYGFVLLTELAARPEEGGSEGLRVANAPELAAETKLPLPMVAKILKSLARNGLVNSHRGVKGGYYLARDPRAITAAEIVRALEGQVALTVCVEGSPGECDREPYCSVRGHWQKVNEAVETALAGITLEDLARPELPPALLVQLGGRTRVPALAAGEGR